MFVNILRQLRVFQRLAANESIPAVSRLLTCARVQKAQTCTGDEIANAERGRKVKKAARNSLDAGLFTLAQRFHFCVCVPDRNWGRRRRREKIQQSFHAHRSLFTFCGAAGIKFSHQRGAARLCHR
jgi:hypothetical protein